MPTIKLDLTIKTEFLDDIIDTAGYGIGYWAKRAVVDNGGDYVIYPQEEFVSNEQRVGYGPVLASYTLMYSDIALAMELLIRGDIDVRSDIRTTLYDAAVTEDSGYIDSEIADVIIQVACFYDAHQRRAILFG